MKKIFKLRNSKLLLAIVFGQLLFSCTQKQKSTDATAGLKIMPANGRVISLDTMPMPEITPLGKTETVPVG